MFNFDGILFNAEQFGNLNYGYTGGHLGLTFDIVISGSIYANNGKIDQNELNDWPYISVGYYHTGSHESMENFRSEHPEWF